jgi:hypothetical protein
MCLQGISNFWDLPGQNWMLVALATILVLESFYCGNQNARSGWINMRIVMLVLALTVVATTNSEAAGSFQRPDPRPVVTAGIAPSLPSISMPNLSAKDLVGGCGKGRVRDPETHGCRGPGDIR